MGKNGKNYERERNGISKPTKQVLNVKTLGNRKNRPGKQRINNDSFGS